MPSSWVRITFLCHWTAGLNYYIYCTDRPAFLVRRVFTSPVYLFPGCPIAVQAVHTQDVNMGFSQRQVQLPMQQWGTEQKKAISFSEINSWCSSKSTKLWPVWKAKWQISRYGSVFKSLKWTCNLWCLMISGTWCGLMLSSRCSDILAHTVERVTIDFLSARALGPHRHNSP